METPYLPEKDIDLKESIVQGFQYDLWANRLWLQALGNFKNLDRPQAVIEHILGAQRVWLSRIGYHTEQTGEDLTLEKLFELVNDVWTTVLKEHELSTHITYQNMEGVTFTNSIAQIMRHVINHGTYHRGHLRGLAMAEGIEDFPETDLIRWFREFD
ncbi:MAG: hypothetical protein KF784_09245 [Fimbriimonadaceae bacterium]|nr:hypothetical protein [Fimbriimonadaceae bacterium]